MTRANSLVSTRDRHVPRLAPALEGRGGFKGRSLASAIGSWVSTMALAAVVVGCSSAPTPLERGGLCIQSVECAVGLACVPLGDGRRACTDDLSAVQTTDPNAFDSGMSDAPTDVIIYADAGATYDTSPPVPPVDDAATDDVAPLR